MEGRANLLPPPHCALPLVCKHGTMMLRPTQVKAESWIPSLFLFLSSENQFQLPTLINSSPSISLKFVYIFWSAVDQSSKFRTHNPLSVGLLNAFLYPECPSNLLFTEKPFSNKYHHIFSVYGSCHMEIWV